MSRKSLRLVMGRQPICANCNAKCVNNEPLFSDALPTFLQYSNEYTQGTRADSVENYLDVHKDHEVSDKEQEPQASTDQKPLIEPDGSIRLDTSWNFESQSRGQGQGMTHKRKGVTIFDALLKVFDFHWKYQKGFRKSAENKKTELRLCNDCARCLSQMYDWFVRFTKLTIQGEQKSYLHPLVFPTLTSGVSAAEGEFPISRKGGEREATDSPVQLGNLEKRDRKRKLFESRSFTSKDASTNPQRENRFKKQHVDTAVPCSNVIRVLPGLRPIKTSFTGDVKSLLACKVNVCKMTPDTVEANLAKIKLEEERDADVDAKCKQELSYPDEDVSLDEYILGVVEDDPDFSPDEPQILKRKRGRPRKQPKLLGKSKSKRQKLPRKTDCDHCGKKLRTSLLLRSHLRIYHQTHYDCSYCGEQYSDRKELKDHLHSVHDEEKREICGDCNKRFFNKLDLYKHSRIHIDRQPVVCNICNGIFPSQTSLKAHMLSHVASQTGLPRYKCPTEYCNKRFTDKFLLDSHIRYMHERRNFFVCPYADCEKSFGTESYLNTHIVSHDRVGTHLCELCGKNYKHKKDLRIHEQRYHSDSKPEELKGFPCGVCSKRYFRADHLRTHRVKANHYIGGQEPELPEPPIVVDASFAEEFKCVTCNRVLVNDRAFKAHLLTHDEDEGEESRQFACSECDRKYISLKALEYHAKYMHKLKASFSCSRCPKSFGRLSSFKRHLSVHSNTQHICGDCNKSYKNKRDLMNHYRREHVIQEASYEYECGGCSKRFYRKDMLRTHMVKTGHPPAQKREYIEEEENEHELAIYIVEEGADIQGECGILEDDIKHGLSQEDDEEPKEKDMLTQPIEHRMESLEMVEITGEDAEGTIAHVVMVDGDGVAQDIETEVICTVGSQDGLDPDLSMFNYSIQLE